MKRIKNAFVACGCLLALCGLLALTVPGVSYGQGGGASKFVEVVNTAANPVPVTGTIAGGTVQAQQSGAWAVSVAGTPTVHLDGAVQIGNTTGAPVPVFDVACGARQPFQAFVVDGFQAGEGNVGDRASFTVPAGKRLVIEHVSFQEEVPAGQARRVRLDAVADGHPCKHHLLLAREPGFGGGTEDVKASQAVRAYADGGTSVVFRVARNSTLGVTSINISVSGYLVDTP